VKRTAISFSSDHSTLTPADLQPFFVGWPNPPEEAVRLQILRRADLVILARVHGRLVGFVTCLTDGLLSAFIPLLEVLPEHQGRGIGSQLIQRLLDELGPLYAVDAVCDPPTATLYENLGFTRLCGMARRELSLQRGRTPASER